MATTVLDVISLVSRVAPAEWAAPWDFVGLQCGDVGQRVGRLLVTLDVTQEVLDEAVALGAKLIVAHHPVIFEPLRRVCPDSNRLIWRAVREGIAIFVAHTNLDVAPQIGTADALADALRLRDKNVALPTEQENVKIVTFVPQEHLTGVIDEMAKVGAGRIGLYDRCAFWSAGTGTFQPGEGARPFIGKVGEREEVPEVRLEMVCPRETLELALTRLRLAHPYEEPAFDVYPLQATATGRGYARVGRLAREATLGAFARRVARTLGAKVRVAGDPSAKVRTVGAIPGSGGKNLTQVEADVIVTGDVKHHEALAAQAQGISVIDAGHYATERPGVGRLAQYLRGQMGRQVEVLESAEQTDRFRFEG